ncbi:MAG: hypothetical protein MZV70_64885 [Desulfobacterales bacterium]|nr:hypothetical protein [Desulfobacterales bacterium]
MNRFLRGSLLAALSGIALAPAGCGGGGDDGGRIIRRVPRRRPSSCSLCRCRVPMRLRAATSSRISLEWVPARM